MAGPPRGARSDGRDSSQADAQQQLARDQEVGGAAMGQRCRPKSFGAVQRCNPLYFLLTAAPLLYSRRTWGCCSWSSPTDQLVRKFKDGLGINMTMKNSLFSYPYSSTSKHHVRIIAWSGVSAACRPQSFGEVQRCNPLCFL